MTAILHCPRCQTPARIEDAAGGVAVCPGCGLVLAVDAPEDEVIDVTAETPEGEIVGRPGPYSNLTRESENPQRPRGFRIQFQRRTVTGPGCCGPGCLIFFLLFLFLLLHGC